MNAFCPKITLLCRLGILDNGKTVKMLLNQNAGIRKTKGRINLDYWNIEVFIGIMNWMLKIRQEIFCG